MKFLDRRENLSKFRELFDQFIAIKVLFSIPGFFCMAYGTVFVSAPLFILLAVPERVGTRFFNLILPLLFAGLTALWVYAPIEYVRKKGSKERARWVFALLNSADLVCLLLSCIQFFSFAKLTGMIYSGILVFLAVKTNALEST